MKGKKSKSLVGKAWPGFAGECRKRSPCYIIPGYDEDGIFICDVIRKLKFLGKKVRITIEEV